MDSRALSEESCVESKGDRCEKVRVLKLRLEVVGQKDDARQDKDGLPHDHHDEDRPSHYRLQPPLVLDAHGLIVVPDSVLSSAMRARRFLTSVSCSPISRKSLATSS